MFVALEMSGQWSATVRADHNRGTLLLRGGIPDLNIRLRPGEEISGPRILLGAYSGKLDAGVNRLRRHIRTSIRPASGRTRVPAHRHLRSLVEHRRPFRRAVVAATRRLRSVHRAGVLPA
jgi:hypothetical protein